MTPDWKGIRLDYSQGMTQSALQAKYGVAASTLRKRIRAEGWSRKESAKVQEDEQISVSVPRLIRVDALADAMLGCLERAVRELDTVTQNVREKSKLEDGAELVTDFERLLPEEKGIIDRGGLKQLTGVLKDIKDVLTLRSDAGSGPGNGECLCYGGSGRRERVLCRIAFSSCPGPMRSSAWP